MFRRLLLLILSVALVSFVACEKSPSESDDDGDIPPDPTNVTVPPTVHNNVVPSADFTLGSGNKIVVNLTGLINPSTGQPIELFADYSGGNYNFYLEEDGIVKGVKLTKVSTSNTLKADIVFVVDISGSMGQEADSVANGIVAFANFLAAAGLDVNFGSVGYYGYIAGALNLTTAANLEAYLNRPFYYGTSRPTGFAGPDSAALQMAASSYASNHSYYDEDGVVGILFADSLFNWRTGAQKIFINFTDEGTQPSYVYKWSTQYICDNFPGYATIHTVFSDDTTYQNWTNDWMTGNWEKPWAMSECTGGTAFFMNAYADSLDLTGLPLTVALTNSYKAEFNSSNPTGTHDVVITVKVTGADGRIEYQNWSYVGGK
jgi:hypothetical protein